jgi:hypothetical protein
LPGGTQDAIEKSQDSSCPGLHSNQASPEYKSEVLLLQKVIQLKGINTQNTVGVKFYTAKIPN